MKVSIIILSWNTKELLRQCLESVISDQQSGIGNQAPVTRHRGLAVENKPATGHRPPITEIIVVDNASTDGSPEMVKEFARKHSLPTLRLIENRTNLGFSRANNQGIRVTKGEMIMFLNSDTIVQPGVVETLFKYLKSKKKVGAICPLILNQDGSVQIDPVYLRYPSLATALFYYQPFLRKIFLKFSFLRKILFCSVDCERPHPIDQLSGAALMVKKEVLDQVGPFDANIPFYFEDSDLSKRIQKAGWETLVEPTAKVIHLRGSSMAKAAAQKKGQFVYYRRNFLSLFLFCQKHYPWWKTASIKVGLIFNWWLTSLFYLPLAVFSLEFWRKIWVNLRLIGYFAFPRKKGGERWL